MNYLLVASCLIKIHSLSETEKGLSTSFGIDYEVDFGE